MKKSTQKEHLDQDPPDYSPTEYLDCLEKLGRVGRLLGGNRAGLSSFSKLKPEPRSILDIGCGGGFFTRLLAEKYPEAKVVGIDINPHAIAFASRRHAPLLPNLSFKHQEKPRLCEEPSSYDVVTATLVCHHLTDGELIDFLQQATQVAKQAVVLNDLHRHPLAWGSFACMAPLLFPNRLIWHDGLLSIRRAFTKEEWVCSLKEAKIDLARCQIKWHFPFRWIVRIACHP